MNKNFFVFGMRGIDDNSHEYYYFDSAGKLGTAFYDQEDDFKQSFDPFLKGSPAKYSSIDPLVSSQISEYIEALRHQFEND